MRIFLGFGLWLLLTTHAVANSACDQALILETYSDKSSHSSDWRLATYMTDDTYTKVREKAKGSASIQGVPVGAEYSKYRESIQNRTDRRNESLNINDARNILWTKLDPNSSGNYRACLEAEAKKQEGLHVSVIAATTASLTLSVFWNLRDSAATASPTYHPAQINGENLSSQTPPGGFRNGSPTPITIPRPKDDTDFYLRNGAYNSAPIRILKSVDEWPVLTNCAEQISKGVCGRCEFDINESGVRQSKLAYKSCTNMPADKRVRVEVSNFQIVHSGQQNGCHLRIYPMLPDGTQGTFLEDSARPCSAQKASYISPFVKSQDSNSATVHLDMPICDGTHADPGSCKVTGKLVISSE
jgi:hypothetical protein